jgi:HD domain
VQPAELPSWAEQQAAALLTGLGDRWSHIQAVAEQGRRVSAALAPEDRPYLIAAAWLHDVGYAPPLNRLGFHPVDGARYVREQGQERLASLVAYHSGARDPAPLRYVGVPPASRLGRARTLYGRMTLGNVGARPAGR